MSSYLNITVIGAGNGGQAIAGHCAMNGHHVCLYNRSLTHLSNLAQEKRIKLYGVIEGTGTLDVITCDIKQAVQFADIIMVATTAVAHRELATLMAPYLKKDQVVILNPGRTGGAWEFLKVLNAHKNVPHVYLAEAQTLIYACRKKTEGVVDVIGIKDKVLLSGINRSETEYILQYLSHLYSCFLPAQNLLHTSLENIGAIFHPCVVLVNAATIERGGSFYFYRDMTPQVAHLIQLLDEERLAIGKAFGLNLISATDWVSYAYPGIQGDSLCDKMKNNPAYYDIVAPSSIYSRQLLEDIPTGLLPMSELGKCMGVKVDIMESIVTLCSSLLGVDFRKEGRTLSNLGLDKMSATEIREKYEL